MQSAIARSGPGLVGCRQPGVASTILTDRGGPCSAGASTPAAISTCAPSPRYAHLRNHLLGACPAAAFATATTPLSGLTSTPSTTACAATIPASSSSSSPSAAGSSTSAGPEIGANGHSTGFAAVSWGAAATAGPLLPRRRLTSRLGRHRRGRGGGSGSSGSGDVTCRAGVLEGFSGVSNLMAPEFATVFSAIIAIISVSINLYGGLLTEKRRAELAREVERERQVMAAADEERSVVARYRGPLLEATVDLEARLYHIATLTAEWRSGDVVCEEEVVYTLFTLSQWLGFLEVIRREGPRERSFLQRGGEGGGGGGGGGGAAAGLGGGGGASSSNSNSGGTDTLTTLVESFRFVLSAHPATLRKWYEQGDEREHPGCRSRTLMLRGTPALPEEWGLEAGGAAAAASAYGSSGYWRERPPPPSSSAAAGVSWPPAVDAAPGAGFSMGGGGGGGFATPYGRMRGAGGHIVPYNAASPPPPTKRVMVYDSAAATAAAAARGAGLATGTAAVGSELVIGSLDEHDLAAAGLGLPDLDMGPEQQELPGPPGASAASSSSPSPSGASAALPTGSGWDAAAAAAAAAAAVASADLYSAAGGGSLSSMGSLSSLSSFDEAGFSLAPAAGGGGGGGGRRSAPRDVFHVSRGAQRSIGSMMVVTPMGASRHYTLSYGDFYSRYYMDPFFASWLRPVHTDILALVGGRRWRGQGPFPLNRWTRLLLLQQLLVETIELLDPAHVRVPANRRVVLAPVPYKQAPELEAYRSRMREMSQLDSPLLMQQQRLQEGGQQGDGPLGRIMYRLRAAAAAAATAAAVTAGADAPAAAAASASASAAPPNGGNSQQPAPPLLPPAPQQQQQQREEEEEVVVEVKSSR
ncbi:hypothetical protein PLESTB_000114100 [Pleodorina starrii]|uniref:Uncharacterized protein n=1 Tax=Pleodorina starrii TaxID=330485 RepID=A0A9W6BAM1_9CHLO|nr:hypothetical protein PLESTB_000114100 [Pleodorina starrii]GLC71909.1 hypothetical protein PLESTF_001179900 [Pleodorina starrii]